MLLRKADWHDGEGIKFLLEHGADPNAITHWGFTALHQSVQRDNSAAIVELILDHGADPMLVAQKRRAHDQKPKSAIQRAARRGRGDLLLLFARRGFASNLEGLENLIAACALDESDQVRSILTAAPQLREELRAEGGMLLAEFAGNGNTGGVRQLLNLGVEVDSVYPGDGYFGIAPDSTALVVAAWRAHPDTVRLLIERGAAVNRPDGKGKTALQLAVRACVESYWTYRRSPDSVRALLAAGATVNGVQYPSGYAEVDELLKAHGATG
jgi:ankyrin repeat protein